MKLANPLRIYNFVALFIAVILLVGLSFSALAQQNVSQSAAQVQSTSIAQAQADQQQTNVIEKTERDVFTKTNVLINIYVALGLIVLYITTYILMKTTLTTRYLILRPQRIIFFWNTLLMLSALVTIVTGFLLMGWRTFPNLRQLGFNYRILLFWHIMGGNVFATLCVLHLVRRFKIYLRQVKVYRKSR